MWRNRYAGGLTIPVSSKLYSILHLHSKLFDAQSVANPSPTCRRPVANQLPTPIAINFQSVGNQSPIGRRFFLWIVVADQSTFDLQPKKCIFDRIVAALVAAVF